MTNKEIMKTYESLMKMRDRSTTRFPARVSFAIARNIRTLEPIYEDIISSRLEVLKEYGDPTDTPGFFTPKIGKEKVMNDELNAIDDTEVSNITLQGISFTDIENFDLSIEDMDAIYFMLDGWY